MSNGRMAADRVAGTRVDALANRSRLLRIAREAFAADPAASLNGIAKLARVGPGTLYRHFATRQELLVEVYREEIGGLAALAPALLAEHPPLAAVRLWFDRFASFGDVKHALADTLAAALDERQAAEAFEALLGAMRSLLQAGVEAGSLKPDVRADDVLALVSTALRVPPSPEGKVQRRRLMDFIVGGLAAAST